MSNPIQLESPLKVTISFTHSCNLDCAHCYADCARPASPRELGRDDWIAFIDDLVAHDIVSILFEGGEPLHRPDFLDVLRHCAGKLLVRLRTNGALVTPAIVAELKRLKVGTVLVDMMGARAETHDFFTGAPGSHALAVRAVEQLRAAGVPTQMLIIMTRQNVGELQGFLELAHGLGVDTAGILRLYPIGRAKRRWRELALSLDEMMAALRALRLPPGLKLMQSWHPNDGNCCWQMAAVNAYGDSIGCSYLREFVNYGNIKQVSFFESWNDPLYRQLRSGEVESACSSCSDTQGSHGGCRSTAFAFHGRWTAPDPFDAPLNQGVDLRELPDWMLQAHPGPARARGP